MSNGEFSSERSLYFYKWTWNHTVERCLASTECFIQRWVLSNPLMGGCIRSQKAKSVPFPPNSERLRRMWTNFLPYIVWLWLIIPCQTVRPNLIWVFKCWNNKNVVEFLYNKLTDAYEAEYDIKLNWSATTTASCFPYKLFVKMLWLADHRQQFLLAFYRNIQLLQRSV